MPGRILEHSPNYRLALKCTVFIHHCTSCFLIRNRKNKLGSCFQYIKCYENNMQYGFHRQRQAFSNYLQIPRDFSSSVFFSTYNISPTGQQIQMQSNWSILDLNKISSYTYTKSMLIWIKCKYSPTQHTACIWAKLTVKSCL